jgi:hypothetical protein
MTSLLFLPAVISMAGGRSDALGARRPLAGKRGLLQDCRLILNAYFFPIGVARYVRMDR